MQINRKRLTSWMTLEKKLSAPKRRTQAEVQQLVAVCEQRHATQRILPESGFELRLAIQTVDSAGEMLGNIQLALDKGLADDQFRGFVRKARALPRFDLLPHRLEVPLHAVHRNRKDVDEAQVLGVLSEYGREHAGDNVAMFRAGKDQTDVWTPDRATADF